MQSRAPVAEGRVRIPEELISCLSCSHEIGDLKATVEGEGIKLCVDGVGWEYENDGNNRPLGEKDYADYVYFPCYYYF